MMVSGAPLFCGRMAFSKWGPVACLEYLRGGSTVKAKKVAAIALSALSIVFLVGAYVLQHFAAQRLGLVRWLNARRQELSEVVAPEVLWYALLVIAVALFAFALWRMWGKGALKGAPRVVAAVYALLVTAGFALAVFSLTRSVTPAYFLIIPLIGIASLCQSASLLLWEKRSV